MRRTIMTPRFYQWFSSEVGARDVIKTNPGIGIIRRNISACGGSRTVFVWTTCKGWTRNLGADQLCLLPLVVVNNFTSYQHKKYATPSSILLNALNDKVQVLALDFYRSMHCLSVACFCTSTPYYLNTGCLTRFKRSCINTLYFVA